jgi:hypothetical protein
LVAVRAQDFSPEIRLLATGSPDQAKAPSKCGRLYQPVDTLDSSFFCIADQTTLESLGLAARASLEICMQSVKSHSASVMGESE